MKVHKSQATVRFETNDSTTTVEFGKAAIAKQAIVGDERERNVDSPSNGLTTFKCYGPASVKRIMCGLTNKSCPN